MKKSNLSLSATVYLKDQRVVARVAPDEWYLGTVTRVGALGVSVDFDDGAHAKIPAADYKHLKVVDVKTKRRKSPLHDLQALALYSPEDVAVPYVKIKIAEDLPTTKNTQQNEVVDVYSMPPVNPSFDEAVDGGPAARVQYLKARWKQINIDRFSNRLELPLISLSKDFDLKQFKVTGSWDVKNRHLVLTVRTFLAGESATVQNMLRQMCHQAASELDGETASHGKRWKSWMIHCGLVPNKIDTVREDLYMESYEKRLVKDQIDTNLAVTTSKVRLTKPTMRVAAQFYDRTSKSWIKGLVLPNGDDPNLLFIVNKITAEYREVPLSLLYELPSDQRERYLGHDWDAAVRSAKQHFSNNLNA